MSKISALHEQTAHLFYCPMKCYCRRFKFLAKKAQLFMFCAVPMHKDLKINIKYLNLQSPNTYTLYICAKIIHRYEIIDFFIMSTVCCKCHGSNADA